MAITYNQKERIFSLHTARTTYQMKADRFGFLLHLYYGARIEGSADYLLRSADRGFSGVPHELGEDRSYSLDALPQEFPVWGQGDYRPSALLVRDRESGAWGCDLRYAGHEIVEGKYALPGLPAAFARDGEEDGYAQTLRIELRDAVLDLRVTLLYGVLEESDVITRAAILTNEGDRILVVEKLLSANLDLVGGDFDVITFHGRHAMERVMQRREAAHGEFTIGSRRGMSSHQYNPMMILCDRTATEDAGRCWSMQFVYSGGFTACAGVDQYGQTRMQMGLFSEQLAYPLARGESLTAPEVLLSYSQTGLTRLSQNLHRCIRRHILRPPLPSKGWVGALSGMTGRDGMSGRDGMTGRDGAAVRSQRTSASGGQERSESVVLLNCWEAAYFDFDGERILRIAREAKALGINMVVMDDGWFGDRCDDRRALGDWQVNEEKLGCSLADLSRAVADMGLRFGLWIEPEMVNERSRLYREHPDWALCLPGREPQLSRSQLVLDFSRAEVRERIFADLCRVIDGSEISYIKWDFNRSIMDVFSAGAADQGRVLYDYMLGVYDFAQRLRERYPHILLEGCSGGGGRFDAGMLYYTPQIWCSDNTDAVDRLLIQHGTSFGYPPEVMGAHVSVCPNEQNGRVTPLETRAVVAAAGTFGYELDPGKLSEQDKKQVREQVEDFKRLRPLLADGEYYRLSDPAADGTAAWELVAADGACALVSAVVLENRGNMPQQYIRLKGLEGSAFYRDDQTGQRYPGQALMEMGLPLPIRMGEYRAHQILLWRE